MQTYDAIVVGAGPGGSATAAFLAQRGCHVALVERHEFPRAKPCAEYLNPQISRIIDHLGATELLMRQSPNKLSGMQIVAADGTSFTGWFDGCHGFRAFADHGLALSRTVLDACLAGFAVKSGATLLEGATVERLGPSGSARRLLIRSGRRAFVISGRLIVGADGLHSRIANELRVARRGRLRRIALVTHACNVDGMRDVGEMHVAPIGYVGLAPLGRDVTNVALVVDVTRVAVPGASVSVLCDILRRFFPAVSRRLAKAQFISPVLGAGPFSRHTTTACADRVLLVGDAADFYDPFTGEGIFAALRGAELVSEVAVSALETDRLQASDLAHYDTIRRCEFGGRWKVERLVSWFVGHPRALNHVARRLAAKQRLADILIGVAGNFVPPQQVLRPQFFWQLVR